MARIRPATLVLLCLMLWPVLAASRQQPVVALVGGLIVDGTGRPAYTATVLIRGQRIIDVGTINPPDGATVLDVTGTRIVPGLIDMHGHMYARATADMRSQFDAYPALYLAGGVTAVRSPGDFDPEGMIALRDRIGRGATLGPRIFVAGPYFDHAPSQVLWIKGTATADEALTQFQLWKGRVDWIKFYTRITEAEFVTVARAAREARIPTTAHLGSITAARAIALGINGLEHRLFGLPEIIQGATGDPNCAPRRISTRRRWSHWLSRS